MLKLLFWGILFYVVYRYLSTKFQLNAGKKRDAFQQHPPPHNGGQEPEEEYIDYEELK